MIRVAAFMALVCGAAPALALDLTVPPNARMTVDRPSPQDIFLAPTGPFADGAVPMVRLEGAVDRKVWSLASAGETPLQLLAPLRDQITAAGYKVVLDCASRECGGFDFRFAVEVLPGPNMYVNIRNYHFLTAVAGDFEDPDAAITVLTSSTQSAAYLQVIQATTQGRAALPNPPGPAPGAAPDEPPQTLPAGTLAQTLLRDGHVVLNDLDFDSGSVRLGPGPFSSLTQLAELLKDRPNLRIALVGHTDSTGSLETNISVSRQRAQAVRQRLIDVHGLRATQLEAEGMGYLAPRASNLTAEGREANRRVEAILLSQ